ncbi:hypothetical protein SARC_04230 [Sphaeroforma arctica JP610]|uniref:Uncharacterized protein n=1 Tax=Sphaeroforma arctica JP610 TaxID=667725 RepID=A0A0L0G5K0_9EUKA|nr:hypothetical protein, variant [Sphaeroforma arctica JP610]XP_014157431.1 hypothetical protein SARC_04230 [Sphaeroforma arctica JP610]KNC83528.1 hypothetical protein, variant [Sphaeroforma arctica JP610]KNC83529.1 hypothetical protein SARC_04230 [Sphaeroforma arctica JP610]|eukprot:XP_014157430.1 hypothetical protein, variant [Sphaeroforma arctica JP610]
MKDITVLPKSSAEKNVPRKLRGTAQISSDTNVTHNASTSQTASSVSQASSILETSKKRIQESEEVLTFQQREKRKRDQGMASRGKNYVEEEKRILRQGGFD